VKSDEKFEYPLKSVTVYQSTQGQPGENCNTLNCEAKLIIRRLAGQLNEDEQFVNSGEFI